ncbi:MAG: hypothetical protein KGI73_01735 [Patescibacteria group bacterium]|nr:hypothetical protein [Patescibacteria group bacterium]
MRRPSFAHTFFILPLLLWLWAVPALAASVSATNVASFAPSLVPQGAGQGSDGLSSCFDTYTFGSVPVTVSPSLMNAAEGSTVVFSGTVKNTNPYPIVDATVYVKIFRERSVVKDVDGPDVVDWFPAVTHLALRAGESLPISFRWSVPSDALPGAYQAATYVAASDRFNLQGLTFTDDVIGGAANFSVVGQPVGSVSFDKTSVIVGGQPFHFAAFPPTVPAGPVAVSVVVSNSTSNPFKGNVHWTLYWWDALQGSHVLASSDEALKIHPASNETATYTVTDEKHSVYYLVGEVDSSAGSKSIVGIRFVRAGLNEPRLNFVGVNQYPTGGTGAIALACAHDAGATAAASTTITLAVMRTGVMSFFGPLASASWSGALSGDIRALTVPVTRSSADSFDVTASLYQNGVLVDQVTVPYRCSALGASCSLLDTWIPLYILAGIIVLLGILWFVIKHHRSAVPPVPPSSHA